MSSSLFPPFVTRGGWNPRLYCLFLQVFLLIYSQKSVSERSLLGHWQVLLEGIVAHPDCNVAQLPLLTAEEQHQLLLDWNATRMPYPSETSLHQLVEEQAQRTPDAVALVSGETSLTYRELNARANQLAHFLRSGGVGPEVYVGICMERCLELVIGLLGILKAGGAYVPLDPSYPQDRLLFILEEAQAPILLTRRQDQPLPVNDCQVVCLDTDWPDIAKFPAHAPLDNDFFAPQAAYVIYTSGSTGRPKGVVNTHQGIVNRLWWMQAAYHLTSADRVLQKTTISFDVSVWEFFWPLLTGACLVMARPGGHKDSAYLVETIKAEQITVLHFVPSMLRILLDEPALPSCRSLRHVICSGEALTLDLQQRFLALLETAALHNLYGPTEAAIDVTFWACVPEEQETAVPIGKPIANTQVYVLDACQQPVPVGVPGELYLGGVGLARGYVQRPDGTADRFVPHAWSQEPGARLYRTGDLVRWRADGVLHYLGRLDHQVKLRGLRIELGEIEAALQQQPQVSEALVLLREDGQENKQLVAYLVLKPDQSPPTLTALRESLSKQVPDYMIPAMFVFMESFPLTPNGKIDRKALPAPTTGYAEQEEAFVAPRTPQEEILVGIWSQILGREKIGVHDHFFVLGGHSLLAAQVMARVRTTWQMDLPLRSIFEEPTIAGFAARIIHNQQAQQDQAKPLLVPQARPAQLPLSFVQERLWFVAEMEQDNPFYNVPLALRLQGTLEREHLQQSLNALIERHEILRTSFTTGEGRPVQVIHASLSLPLPITDLSSFPLEERDAQVQWQARQEIQQPFDLSTVPLLRARLLHLDQQEHVLLLTLHHILTDGWSLRVLARELAALSSAFSQQPAPSSPLPALPLQYADYALWQRNWLQGEVLEQQLAYWKNQLAGAPLVLELPADHPRPAVQSYRGANIKVEFTPELSAQVKALSQPEGVTPFMTLLAGWQILLARYTGQHEILVGSPIISRNQSELEGLIGCFLNTLVLRTSLAGEPSVHELLQRVREVTLGAYAHQDLPFESLVEMLQPARDLSRPPVVQISFTLQTVPSLALTANDLQITLFPYDGTGAKYDLEVVFTEMEGRFSGLIIYSTDLFEEATIRRMSEHWQVLLQAMTADPGQPIHSLPLLTAGEQHQLLVDWNAARADYPATCLHQTFEAQVERTPDRVAVIYGEEQITYTALNQRANQLAYHLQVQGVGPDVLVGICVERSLEMVIGVLGILKAGGAYLPLDPLYPEARLAFMLEDAQVPMLVTQRSLLAGLPEYRGQIVCLDADWPAIAQQSTDNPCTRTQPNHLVYVIYTSGSTGKPKGVQIEHHSMLNFLYAMCEKPGITAQDRLLAVATLSFDIAGLDLFLPLMTGAQVVIASREVASDGQQLLAQLTTSAATIMQATPVTWRLLLEAGWSGSPDLKILCGGEALSRKLTDQLLERVSSLWNMYGPTETTVWSTLHHVRASDQSIVIGRPIANMQFYVLDQHLQLVPVGVPGELYIGGSGLGRGYLNRPELTTERFLAHPFDPDPQARFYRTGDLARYLPDGKLECLGRLDHQVKLRGFRIELGEIEAVLLQQPQVAQALVLLHEDDQEKKKLVAYLVLKPDQSPPSVAALREGLGKQVPNYMIPATFVFMESFPLNPNGKIDRKALPAPMMGNVEQEEAFVAPRTPQEEILAGIWSQILGREKIGIHDNFFALGGDSLLTIRVVLKARQAGIAITLKQFMQAQTISALAEKVSSTVQQQAEQEIVTGPVPLIPFQRWLFQGGYKRHDQHQWNVTRLMELSPQEQDPTLWERAVQSMLLYHDALRMRFVPSGSDIEQFIAGPDAEVPFVKIDLSLIPVAEQRAALEANANRLQTSLNLSEGPLIRVALFHLGSEKPGRLLVIVHHLVIDGYSFSLLLEDLLTAYHQLSRREALSLPPKTTSYKEWVERFHLHLQSAELQRELDSLLSLPWEKAVSVPLDYPDKQGPQTMATIRQVTVALSIEETTALLEIMRVHTDVQLLDVLLTAFTYTLSKWVGEQALAIDVVHHGRDSSLVGIDLTRTVGICFYNVTTFFELGKGVTPESALPIVKEQFRRINHTVLGYAGDRICLTVDGYTGAWAEMADKTKVIPQPQISFNYLGQVGTGFSSSSSFRPAAESPGAVESLLNLEARTLYCPAMIVDGQFRIAWGYSENLYRHATIEQLAQTFIETLKVLIHFLGGKVDCQALPRPGGEPGFEVPLPLYID